MRMKPEDLAFALCASFQALRDIETALADNYMSSREKLSESRTRRRGKSTSWRASRKPTRAGVRQKLTNDLETPTWLILEYKAANGRQTNSLESPVELVGVAVGNQRNSSSSPAKVHNWGS